ncbi:carbonic anhydrase family protein [Listeria booriae]|nr:carbonic anhydrase family protein [Listeria booriae]
MKKMMMSVLTVIAGSVFVLGGCAPHSDTIDKQASAKKEATSQQVAASNTSEKRILDWSYSGKTGPKYWGELNKAYQISNTGKEQSPININTQTARTDTNKTKISYQYQPTMFQITRKDKMVQAVAQQAKGRADSKIKVGGKQYTLKEINIHTPSEHQLDGNKYDAELQLTHKSTDNKTLIISIFIKQGVKNQAVGDLTSVISTLGNGKTMKMKSAVSTLGLIPENGKIYQYQGSLTTPATTEGVTWMVYQMPITMSKQQIQDLQKNLNNNNRPIQDLNKRTVVSN